MGIKIRISLAIRFIKMVWGKLHEFTIIFSAIALRYIHPKFKLAHQLLHIFLCEFPFPMLLTIPKLPTVSSFSIDQNSFPWKFIIFKTSFIRIKIFWIFQVPDELSFGFHTILVVSIESVFRRCLSPFSVGLWVPYPPFIENVSLTNLPYWFLHRVGNKSQKIVTIGFKNSCEIARFPLKKLRLNQSSIF